MEGIRNKCFVCKKEVDPTKTERNTVVNLPVCSDCKGTPKEKETEEEYLDSLAEGFVCGCI